MFYANNFCTYKELLGPHRYVFIGPLESKEKWAQGAYARNKEFDMITFLPSPNFNECARVLDNKRLGRQRLEAKWVLRVIYTMRNHIDHPLVRMWKDYKNALCAYGMTICKEWVKRGYKDNQFNYFFEKSTLLLYEFENYERPIWLGDDRLHSSHRIKLLNKDYVHYSQFGWKEEPDFTVNYWWPL